MEYAAEELYPGVAGEYRKVDEAEYEHGRPVWRHTRCSNIIIVYDGTRWRIKDTETNKLHIRSSPTSQNMIVQSKDWEYFDYNNCQWSNNIHRDLELELFPEHFEVADNEDSEEECYNYIGKVDQCDISDECHLIVDGEKV